MRICATRLAGPAELSGMKHLNRLSQVLARAEWDGEFDEGLMRNSDGQLVEGTMSNLFAVRDNELLAPPVGLGVRGVMRHFVLQLAGCAQIAVHERALTDAELETADEIFITNSVIGICPVRRFGRNERTVGTITRQLQSAADKELDQLTCHENS